MRDRLWLPLAVAAALAAVPLPAVHALGPQQIQVPGWIHFVFVGHTAVLATIAAVVLTAVGLRRRNSRAVRGGGVLVHGRASRSPRDRHARDPRGYNGVISFSGGATLPIGGAILALSVLPAVTRPGAVRPLLWLQGALLAAIVALGAIGLATPSLVPAVPAPASPAAIILLGLGLLFYGVLGFRALRTYFLTRRVADLVAVVGLA